MNRHDRYIAVARKLQNRYRGADGKLTITRQGKATRYSILDNMAAIKYLGCDPNKMVSAVSGLPEGFMVSLRIRMVKA